MERKARDEPPPWLDKNGKPIGWYAGKQYDDDTANAKKVLAELDKYYPGRQKYEIAGFFFWQGDKDRDNAAHAGHYEENLVRFIKQLRKDFDAPNAKFVLATLGETEKGSGGNAAKSSRPSSRWTATSGNIPSSRAMWPRSIRIPWRRAAAATATTTATPKSIWTSAKPWARPWSSC